MHCFSWHILHDEIALVSGVIVNILDETSIVKFDDLAVFELFELFGAQQEGFFGFKGDERGVKYFDDDVFLALFAKIEAAGGAVAEQARDGVGADALRLYLCI